MEASAFLDLTLPVVRYRVAGIHRGSRGAVETPNRIIYSPPVNLAKPPDTTAHGRQPRS